jgi:hypothetical protein
MTPNEKSREFERAIIFLERELMSPRPFTEEGRYVLGRVLAALWVLHTKATEQPEGMFH